MRVGRPSSTSSWRRSSFSRACRLPDAASRSAWEAACPSAAARYSLLRLSGVPLTALRHVVVWESVVPLLAAAAVAVAAGFGAAALFLRSQLGYGLMAPGVEYYVVLGGGLLAALAIVASTMPLLRRLTGPEMARNG